MKTYSNDCCGCASPGYPCIGDRCSLRHVLHLTCDECGKEKEYLYNDSGFEICEDCLLKKYERIERDGE